MGIEKVSELCYYINIINEGMVKVMAKKTRLEIYNNDNTPNSERVKMTQSEMIKNWIDNRESVLLIGASGVGKTERIHKLYPDRVFHIKLTNGMFPEKVVGSMNLQTGENIPPEFATNIILEQATEDERKLVKESIQNIYSVANSVYENSRKNNSPIVLLLDELLNVTPAIQSLVYTLVLNRIIECGKGIKLPENVVVVATGNQKKYSMVAEDLAEPLLKRFDHILEIYANPVEWVVDYAIPENVHPLVISYIASKNISREGDNISYFYEGPEVAEDNVDEAGFPGKTNDPRGWTAVSKMLYNFEKDLMQGRYKGKNVEEFLKETLKSKLREEWAEDFFDHYNSYVLSVEEVVSKNYDESQLPTTLNEKFAQTIALISANSKEVEKCKRFINDHCGKEQLKIYDLMRVEQVGIEEIENDTSLDEMYDEFGDEEIEL